MSNVERQLRWHYQPLDPAEGLALPSQEERDADLARILAEPVARPALLTRRRLAVAAVVAATVATATVIGVDLLHHPIQPANGPQLRPLVFQADPALPPAAELLWNLAVQVENLPEDQGTGPLEQVRSRNWWLFRPQDRATPARLETEHKELLYRPDGSMHIKTTSSFGFSGVFQEVRPGEWQSSAQGMPATELAFGQWLRQRRDDTEPIRAYRPFLDLVEQRALGPRHRAWLLRELATVPGLKVAGRVTDHSGRRGLAITMDVTLIAGPDIPIRNTLIIDERDGRILAFEQVQFKDQDGHFDIPFPAVRHYTEYLGSERRHQK